MVVALAICFACAGCTKPATEFRRVELTKDDIVSLFEIPLEQMQLEKFEWPLGREHYVRAILDCSDDAGKTWREFQVFPRDLPVVEATLIYRLRPPTPTAENNDRILELRLGGRGIGTFGWSGSSALLKLPPGSYRSETQFTDPARLLTLGSGSRAYRLRLEARPKPWVKS